jgi:NAD(P)-dependent dehydrogenase (short-subunit alcohol dehydrogenase family)
MPIDDRPSNIVITGVTRGLGRAMVDEFVRLGHAVCGCARTKDSIEELVRRYPGHSFQTVDVASDVQVKAWAEHIVPEYGPPDFVLNNAAVLNVRMPLWEVTDCEFSDAVDVNIKGVANVVRHFAPSMIHRRRGVIVNFSSRWGKTCESQMAPYCATKWAVVALTRALGEELRPEGVAAVALNPGVVRTGMLERYLGDARTSELSSCLSPAEWARAAVPLIHRLCLRDAGKMRNVLSSSNPHLQRRACGL